MMYIQIPLFAPGVGSIGMTKKVGLPFEPLNH